MIDMFKVQGVFKSPKTMKEIFLDWIVLETPPALIWFKLLLRLCQKDQTFYPRFSGFISPHKTMQDIQNQLNQCIDIINVKSTYKIYDSAPAHFSQDFANRIHHHFEILRGSVGKESSFFQNTDWDGVRAILNLNHLIHDMESLHRSRKTKKGFFASCGISTEVIRPELFKIPDDCFSDFTLDVGFGDMVLHYTQIGKTWWEVFLDQDEDIDGSAILPNTLMSGEFDVLFLSTKVNPTTKQEFANFLRKRNLDPSDPKLALGYLPVAQLARSNRFSDADYLKMISAHLTVTEFRLLDDQKVIGLFKANSEAYTLNQNYKVLSR